VETVTAVGCSTLTRMTVVIRETEPTDASDVAELLGVLGYPVDASEAAARLARRNETVFVAEDGF
jgi:hypothetical protein